jgi:hypothetical protein
VSAVTARVRRRLSLRELLSVDDCLIERPDYVYDYICIAAANNKTTIIPSVGPVKGCLAFLFHS